MLPLLIIHSLNVYWLLLICG